MGTSEKLIVRVEYTLPGRDRKSAYWRMQRSTIAGWRYEYETTAVSYYLNFL